ncbi:MAG: hypothetical protein IJP11_03430 [Oscillospiraceae bacterium]|nr:hypothetical protein [Oscillospiraceae bacterium]
MKKLLIVLTVLAMMLLLLTGCAEVPSITGKWTMQVSYADLTGNVPSDAELGELAGYVDFDTLQLSACYTFHEDRTYTFKAEVEQYIKDCRTFWIEAINAYYTDQIAARNLAITVEEAWELDGIEIEDLVDAEAIRAAFAGIGSEGNYKVSDGKLYLSASKEYRVDESVYTVFTVSGDTMTFTEAVGTESSATFPVTLTKTS